MHIKFTLAPAWAIADTARSHAEIRAYSAGLP